MTEKNKNSRWIGPSILSADFAFLGAEVEALQKAELILFTLMLWIIILYQTLPWPLCL